MSPHTDELLSKQEQMYEKYLQRQSDYVPIKCAECKIILCYSYGDVEGMLDYTETPILCKNCKELLP